ncbi:MAG: nucleotidyltransferase domain-containing protein [Saprospiraceae bacterium]|nr:nucleotidyltransferase domain-containing protein [Saprospiraceae bacterium]
MKVLVYFDLFDHPLRFDEIVLFIDQVVESQDVEWALNHLQLLEAVEHLNGYWGLSFLSKKIQQRELRNGIAVKRKRAVQKFSKIVATFPFVKAVFLTGSFSKGVMWHDSDIDFFIVTDPGKLWVTKALMVLFRKIILFDSHRNFCINYLVSSDNLIIQERNIFTATELITMIPVFGHQTYSSMMSGNKWVSKYFPLYENLEKTKMEVRPRRLIKRILEIMFDTEITMWMGEHFMKLSEKKYRTKYHKGLTESEYNKAIVVSPKVSKVHPQFFQKHIVEKYDKQCEKLFKSYSISTNHHG